MTKRVLVSSEAAKVIAALKEKFGPLMFHQSGGCCDGSQPMCFEKGEFKVGGSDIKIGNIENDNEPNKQTWTSLSTGKFPNQFD